MKEVKPSMPAQVTNYQCPSCTGPLHFVGASGKLECDYCGASYDVAEIEALYAEKEEKAAAAQQAEEKKAAEKQAAEKHRKHPPTAETGIPPASATTGVRRGKV